MILKKSIDFHIQSTVSNIILLERSIRCRRHRGHRRFQVGWITARTLKIPHSQFVVERLGHLGPAVDMRITNNVRWINSNSTSFWNELYNPCKQYDIVVFVKAMDAVCQDEAHKIKNYGGKVIFDANVNYYEIWGEYDIPLTCPTPQQQQDAIQMTLLADWVVADSSYLLNIIKKHTLQASWIPDNVNLNIFRGMKQHSNRKPLRLVWSGISQKAKPLLLLKGIFGQLAGLVELVFVSDKSPETMRELQQVVSCFYISYSDKRYAKTLLNCDVIISPKNLINGYEMGHTEYKITLGMAVGLPALGSPQQSYIEAITYKGGGIIASTTDEWYSALERMVKDYSLRAKMGEQAHRTVVECYSTPVVARQYLSVLNKFAA